MTEKRCETTTEERLEPTNGRGGQGVSFLKGVFAGALVGTAAGILFAPQAYAALRSFRRRVTDTAANISDAAAEQYRQTSAQVNDAVDDLHQKGRGAYGKALSAVVRGAQDVENRATEAQAELHRRAPKASARHSS